MAALRTRFLLGLFALFAGAAFNAHAGAMAALTCGHVHTADADVTQADVDQHHAASGHDSGNPHKTLHCASGCMILANAERPHLHAWRPMLRLRPVLSVSREGQMPPALLRPPNDQPGTVLF